MALSAFTRVFDALSRSPGSQLRIPLRCMRAANSARWGLRRWDAQLRRRSDGWRRLRAAQQGLVRGPFACGIERLKELHLAGREQRDRDAIAKEHAVAGER